MLQGVQVSVAVAKFEDIVARGLRALIDDDESLRLVAAEIAFDRLPETIALHRPKVVILNFGSLVRVADLRELNRSFSETRIVVLADHPTPSECRQMLAFGATACLAKNTEARDVLHTIHLASRGLHVLPPSAVGVPDPAGPDLLTPREAEVLELLQSGRSNAEIAHALYVGVETVRTHTRRIYRKLGVRTRRELRGRR